MAFLVPWSVRRLGHWLVVADLLERAPVIAVLGGQAPFRAIEAASLYRQGWAPEIWLTRAARRADEGAFIRLGIQLIREESYNREVLLRLGVRSGAVRILDEGVINTADEIRLLARELQTIGGDRVIVVTSKAHSRRVRATWRAIIGDAPRVIVRYAADDPYDAARWWRHANDALAVSREVFGLMNVWAGFPIQPDRSQSKEGPP
jgi:uncharacterized SAM-binding protein YcdF (DUF218 family)